MAKSLLSNRYLDDLPPRFLPAKTIKDDAIATGAASTKDITEGVELILIHTLSDAGVFFKWGNTVSTADDGWHVYIPKSASKALFVPGVDASGDYSKPTQFSLIADEGTAKVRIEQIKDPTE